MSLWGATVITNLFSAIPWIGQSLVEFLWGGFLLEEEPLGINKFMPILLNAGIIPIVRKVDGYVKTYNCINVIKPNTRGLSAGIRDITYFKVPQRLHAGDLSYAYLVGLIEADGWFSISKKGEYLLYEFGLELATGDEQLIYKIKSLLGIGTVHYRDTKDRSKTILLRVRNKSHLIDIILPIFDRYPMISNKQYDYLRFKNSLVQGIKHYKDLGEYIRPTDNLHTIDSILSLPYFSSWLVGFIEGEGCFSTYKPSSSNSLVASFDIGQTNAELLIQAIAKHLGFRQSIYKDSTNCYKLKVSSVRSIENVIKFMHNTSVKLLGFKKLQYILWLKELRHIERYKDKIKIPQNY